MIATNNTLCNDNTIYSLFDIYLGYLDQDSSKYVNWERVANWINTKSQLSEMIRTLPVLWLTLNMFNFFCEDIVSYDLKTLFGRFDKV